MILIAKLLLFALDVYVWIIVGSAVIGWLIAFEVIKVRSSQAANLVQLLDRLTAPVYRPLRKYIPVIGGIDITPIVVLFIIHILRMVIAQTFLY